MDDLVAWLRAQLDEDGRVAAAAERAVAERGQVWPDVRAYTDEDGDILDEFTGALTPTRVLRDVEAKRQILAYADHMFRAAARNPDDTLLRGNANAYRVVLHCLATAYCDRPGYQDGWKP